ncbi:hypothetical protein V8C37DRAFT_302732 [Trichoderma ceciliae]
MKASTGVFGEAYASCFSCLTCWDPLAFRIDERPQRHDNNRVFPIINDQPTSHPPPMAVPEVEPPRPSWRHKVQKTFTSSQAGFSARNKAQAAISRPRLQISAPFEFRHLDSGSFQFPFPAQRPSRPWESPLTPDTPETPFEPLRLNILSPGKELSPMLPDFSFPHEMSTPSPVHLPGRPYDEHSPSHKRSHSSTSFHIPRKNVAADSFPSSPEVSPLNLTSDKQTRTRAYTPSDMETIKERVACAMNEVEQLQRKINDIIERQSLYTASRPSTAHSMARTVPDAIEVPIIPALPPAAPSFAERLNTEVSLPNIGHIGPITASVHISQLEAYEETLDNIRQLSQPMREEQPPPPPPPPLPLVLRPPLRKKKSFSRVSTWLFQEPERNRNQSLDSITNVPRPIKGSEGFYQCVTPPRRTDRRSIETFDTLSTWSTNDGGRTVPTAWSPRSTPTKKEDDLSLERSATFGKSSIRGGGAVNVGVAI